MLHAKEIYEVMLLLFIIFRLTFLRRTLFYKNNLLNFIVWGVLVVACISLVRIMDGRLQPNLEHIAFLGFFSIFLMLPNIFRK
jgi:hypothetical protein